jgi:hypothetical protein
MLVAASVFNMTICDIEAPTSGCWNRSSVKIQAALGTSSCKTGADLAVLFCRRKVLTARERYC